MKPEKLPIHIVGAGLAGSECALQLAHRGHHVKLYDVRVHPHLDLQSPPPQSTPAHKTSHCAELVCSNSFGSLTENSAPGQLKWEARKKNSFILDMAQKHFVPAGTALAVNREQFAQEVTERLYQHPLIEVISKEIQCLKELPRPTVIATGPLTLGPLAQSLRDHFESQFLYFFDAIAPIIDADSINYDIAWYGDRYDKGTKDYLNCPLDKEQYYRLIEEIKQSRKVEAKSFEEIDYENTPYFNGCMPIEEMARRGDETLRFGPLSPKGLQKQGSEGYKYAVVQLRKENKEGTAFNMVGFQTKMAYSEQIRVFKTIPGLEEAEFLKLGSVHRNLYIHSPSQLTSYLSSKKDDDLFFAGQITGVEGYFESTCMGLLVAEFLHQKLLGEKIKLPHRTTALGSLLHAVTSDERASHFQPTNINFSLFPNLDGAEYKGRKNKSLKRENILKRAKEFF